MVAQGLKIKSIHLRNFRNYEEFVLPNIGDLALLIGPNAIGKTNLIEAIQLTTALTSFRNPQTQHLIREGEAAASISSYIGDGNREITLEARFNSEGRTYFQNGKKKQARFIRGLLPSVLFCPDDLNLLKGSQSIRRSSLDQLGGQLSSNYQAVRKDYEKILRQKNKYLKEDIQKSYLASINDVVAAIGAHLYLLRSQLVSELEPYIAQAYENICQGKEKVSISYIPSWMRHDISTESYTDVPAVSREAARERLLLEMDMHFTEEHDRHVTLYGPQRDMIEFFLNGKNASLFASQGQQRSLVLSYKMAEVALIRDKIGYNPVLLLDDVMSELDSNRRRELVSLISGEVQTIISATNKEYFDQRLLDDAHIYMLGGE